jgi:hypothetical protein
VHSIQWPDVLRNLDTVAVLPGNTPNTPESGSVSAQAARRHASGACTVQNLWAHTTREPAGLTTASIPPGSAPLYRISPLRAGWAGTPRPLATPPAVG